MLINNILVVKENPNIFANIVNNFQSISETIGRYFNLLSK